MQQVRHVTGMIERFFVVTLIIALAGIFAPEQALAEGPGGVKKKTERTKPAKPSALSAAQKSGERAALTRERKRLGNMNFFLEDEIKDHDLKIKGVEREIGKEHEKQVKADKQRQALEKRRNRVIMELQRDSLFR